MSNELVAQLDASAFFRETSVGYDPVTFSVLTGAIRGVSFQKLIQAQLTEYYNCSFTVPANLTMGTGLTLQFRLVDDGQNAADLGTNVVIGVTAFDLDAAGFLTNLTAGGGTEQTATITLSATSGKPVSGSIAIASAQLGGATVGSNVVFRVRRIGDNASDTCPGRVIMLNAHVKNT